MNYRKPVLQSTSTMKILLIVFTLIASSVIALYGQVENRNSHYLNVEPIFTWSNSNELSMNVGYFKHKYLDEYPVAARGPFIGAGATLGGAENALITKLGYAYYNAFFGARMQAMYYTNFTDSQFAIRPELGLSFVSWLNLLYGYTFYPESDKGLISSRHTISLSVNLSSVLICR